jgi:hypothetical protein
MGEDDYEKYDKKPVVKKKKVVKKAVPVKKNDNSSNVLEEIDEDAVPSFITKAAEEMTGTDEETEKSEKKKVVKKPTAKPKVAAKKPVKK